MGKWDEAVKTLPKIGEEANYQFRVDQAKAEIADRDPSSLAATFVDLRLRKDAIEDGLSAVNLRIKAVEQLLTDAYEAAGITATKLLDGSSVSKQLEPVAQVTDDVAFWQWCQDNDLGKLMKLPYQTANSLVKDRLTRGEPTPPGVAAYVRTKIVLRKG